MSFVGRRQPTWVELKRVRDGGGLRGGVVPKEEGWETWLLMKEMFFKDAYREASLCIGTGTRNQERSVFCFNWVAASGHWGGGQKFKPQPCWSLIVLDPPSLLSFFQSLFYISLFLQLFALFFFTTFLFPFCPYVDRMDWAAWMLRIFLVLLNFSATFQSSCCFFFPFFFHIYSLKVQFIHIYLSFFSPLPFFSFSVLCLTGVGDRSQL